MLISDKIKMQKNKRESIHNSTTHNHSMHLNAYFNDFPPLQIYIYRTHTVNITVYL